MPALTRIRTPALLDLAEQQRYTPTKALLRQIGRAEELAIEIDPALTYPEDWVVFRITGFRPDLEDPRIIPGEALRGDLSALVERLSDRARLERDTLDSETLSLDQLGERWSVSRKTLERYRRRGLVGRRVVDARSSAAGAAAIRLVFTRRAVEAFERANPALLGAAAGLSRLDEPERDRLLARAARYRDRLGWTRHQIIGRLAVRLGRSRETVRRALEEAPGVAPAAARLAPDETREILEADRRGAEPEALAARFGRSRASIHRVINARRAEMLRRLDLSIPVDPEAERRRLAPALDDRAAREGLDVEPILDPTRWIDDARSAPAEAAGEERVRALAYHALRDRAHRTIESLDRHNPSALALDRAETDLRWATLLKRALTHAQRGLVLRSIEERAGGELLALPPERLRALHRLAFAAVGEAVDRHWRGRLAAPVSLALGRALGHEPAPTPPTPAGRAARRITPGADRATALVDWSASLNPWQAWLAPPAGIGDTPGLDERARRVVRARFGLDGRAPMTLEEIETELGVGRTGAAPTIRAALRVHAGE